MRILTGIALILCGLAPLIGVEGPSNGNRIDVGQRLALLRDISRCNFALLRTTDSIAWYFGTIRPRLDPGSETYIDGATGKTVTPPGAPGVFESKAIGVVEITGRLEESPQLPAVTYQWIFGPRFVADGRVSSSIFTGAPKSALLALKRTSKQNDLTLDDFVDVLVVPTSWSADGAAALAEISRNEKQRSQLAYLDRLSSDRNAVLSAIGINELRILRSLTAERWKNILTAEADPTLVALATQSLWMISPTPETRSTLTTWIQDHPDQHMGILAGIFACAQAAPADTAKDTTHEVLKHLLSAPRNATSLPPADHALLSVARDYLANRQTQGREAKPGK